MLFGTRELRGRALLATRFFWCPAAVSILCAQIACLFPPPQHQSAKDKAEDYEERLRKVEQSTGLHIDLRNVGDVVDLVMRQRKLKDLQVRRHLADLIAGLECRLYVGSTCSTLHIPERLFIR